jgi:hypothetical protein
MESHLKRSTGAERTTHSAAVLSDHGQWSRQNQAEAFKTATRFVLWVAKTLSGGKLTTSLWAEYTLRVGVLDPSQRALAGFRRKVRQPCEGLRLDLGLYFRIVAVEASNPSFASSSRMRGLPQVGLTVHIRRISSISAASFRGRPPRCRDFHRQNILNPARCQPMTVSGLKRINALRQFGHPLFKTTQNNRSLPCSLGLCACRLSTAIWCRRAKFSKPSSCLA